MRAQESVPGDGPAPEGQPGFPRAGTVAGLSGALAVDDAELDAEFERWAADIEAGRRRIPEEWELEGPSVSVSLGDAADLDPALLAAICGPDGLGGTALSAAFGQDQAADVLRPGPILAALTEQAVEDLAVLTDDQLTGALSAARRLENRAAYLQTVVIAEYARRRDVQREEARARKVPPHRRPGQFPGEELAIELVSTARYADERIWEATDLATRLPRTLAAMAAGTVDTIRAHIIWSYTWALTAQDAAHADEVLAAAAPGLRPDQLGGKAARLEMKLDPQAVRRRRERARKDGQRVEVKHEQSGNAILAGRELDPVTALAAKANIDALAVKLRNAAGTGSLQHLRAWVMTELLRGRDPLGHLTVTRATEPASPQHQSPANPGSGTPSACADEPGSPPGGSAGPSPRDWRDDPGYRDDQDSFDAPGFPSDDGPHGPGPDSGSLGDGNPERDNADVDETVNVLVSPAPPANATPLPALINVLVPAGTLFGWSTAPAQAGGWGLLDADETNAFVAAASHSPRTRFCMTLIAPDGTALAHGCAHGRHPWPPPPWTPPPRTTPPWTSSPETAPEQSAPATGDRPGQEAAPAVTADSRGTPPAADDPRADQVQQLADMIRQLNITFRPIVKEHCDHTDAEDHYTPSRGLKHLVRARTATCTAPACNAQAIACDLDHTVAYPHGPTCQCNLAPKCRRHHQCKQAPGWNVEQPEPGVVRWTVPSGRAYTITPTVYDH
jgi:hypothetical protein